jgi:hypothetical protein
MLCWTGKFDGRTAGEVLEKKDCILHLGHWIWELHWQ